MKKGYTLIELMTALIIITIAGLCVYKTFTSGWLAWDSAIKRGEALQNARSFIKVLTKDLKTVVAAESVVNEEVLKILKDAKRNYFKLIGGENSLEMICYSRPVTYYWPEYFPRRSSICYVSYYIASNSDEETSFCVYRKVKWDNAILPWKDEEIEKFDDILNVQFSFLDSGKKTWEVSWNTDEMMRLKGSSYTGLLPRAVKVNITSKGGNLKPDEVRLETIVALPTFEK
ncbi:MAG: prepilin-type N-terminal cleavage/methylation domain-containing protein [Candidatus Firestonebacteria bacterium]